MNSRWVESVPIKLSNCARIRDFLRLRARFHVVIQFVCQFPRQTETADEAILGAFPDHQFLGVNYPQHQLPLWLVQSLNELQVAVFYFLFRLYRVQNLPYSDLSISFVCLVSL